MRLFHEIAIFQTVKSKVIISLFETVRLSVSISLRNLYNSLNSIKEIWYMPFHHPSNGTDIGLPKQADCKLALTEYLRYTGIPPYLQSETKQEAQGLILLTWVFCNNLVKIHLEVIEILSFSSSVLLLVKADGEHLAVPNCKKILNGLIQRLL